MIIDHLVLIFILVQLTHLTKYVLMDPSKHDNRLIKLQKDVRAAIGPIVKKNSGHLFGLKQIFTRKMLDMSQFDNILSVNHDSITVESSVTIKTILEYLVPLGKTLQVTPDMGHLTAGGIVAGVGGGSSSFRYGYFHEALTQFDIVVTNGDVLTCSRTENSDLFHAVPNTLGTLGYIIRMTFKTRKCSPYVQTNNKQYRSAKDYFQAIDTLMADETIDFLDGTIYSSSLFVLVIGRYKEVLDGPLDNFINDKVYWKAIKTEPSHWFKTLDYIYRWDTDLYYTSLILPEWMNSSAIRKCVPQVLIPWVKKLLPYVGVDNNIEDIVADVLIPFKHKLTFFEWYDCNIGLYPLYICPAQALEGFTFWPNDLLCDFGIGYGIECANAIQKTEDIERKMIEFGGRKLPYSRVRMSESDFWKIYDRNKYLSLREKYGEKFPSLYTKLS